MEEQQAIEKLKRDANDEKALEFLYKKYALEVIRWMTYKGGAKPEIAEEIIQEVFLELPESIQSFQYKSFRNWIITISYNLYKDYLRRVTLELNKGKNTNEDFEIKRKKAFDEAKVTFKEGIKITTYREVGEELHPTKVQKEEHISSEEMQLYLDNHNRAIDGWNDTSNGIDIFEKRDIQDCLKNAFSRFAKDGGRNQDDRAYVLSLIYIDIPLEDIAKKINRTYDATKVFISETKKKFMPYSRPCFELLKS